MTKQFPHRTARSSIVLALAACAIAIPASSVSASPLGWFRDGVKGNGHVQKQSREPGRFNGIALGVPGDVELRVDGSESVTIETDENIQQQIETVVENGILRIRDAKRNGNFSPTVLKIVVHAKNIDRLTVGGSGSISAEALQTPKLKVEVGGSGSVQLRHVDTPTLSVSIGGSGNFKADGRAERFAIAIGGSGGVSAGQLESRDVMVSIGGSGEAIVWATKALDISIGGSGNVQYYGDPQLSKSTQGSGSVRRLGDTPR